MKSIFSILGLLFALSSSSFAQNSQVKNDTSEIPYWIDMMQDPGVNFYQTQRAFQLYWQDREVTKGSGYKPFKRWEYQMSELIDAKGNIPKPGSLEKRVEDYIKAFKSGGSNSSGSGLVPAGGGGSVKCLTNGNWVEIGPKILTANRTGQPNGLGRINSIAFHPTDSNKILVGAPAGGLWTTVDGGKNWISNTDSLATLGISSIAIDPQNPDTIYMGTGDRDGGDSYGRGVFRSFDGGQTWNVSNTGMGNQTVGRLIIHPANSSILIAGCAGGIYRSTNYGANWSRVQTGNFRDIVFDAVNPSYVYAGSYSNTKFYRSTNSGQSWTLITSGLPTGKRRMAIAVTEDDSNFVYAIVTNSRTFEGLYLSTNRGVSFTQMSNSPNIMDYSANGSGTSGQAWYDLDLAADPNDKETIYVGGVNIFKSTDRGKTWKINAHWVGSGGAPAIHADQHVLEYQPGTDNLYVGNDGGVYFTDNGGSKWTDISEGIGIAQIYRLGQSATTRDLVINGFQDNGTGLYENGSWFTVLGGDGMDCVIDPKDPKYGYSDLYYGDVRRYTNGRSSGRIAANGKNGITESGAWVTPFVLKEGTPSTMFIGYKNVWRSTNIQNTSSASVTWTKISNNLGSSNTKNIVFLENSPASTGTLYMSRSDSKMFKTSNIGATSPTWTDLTSKLPNNSNVNWIESHSTMKDRLWIIQSNKVYRSDDGGDNWSNWSTGLPGIPLLSIVYDSSSKNEGMYLGTYMGVYYRDTTMSDWIWYNVGMPINTRVRDVEIFYDQSGRDKSHVICATYGRGNWRSPLYDEEQLAPIADFSIDENKICANQTVKLSDLSLRNPTRWNWTISPGGAKYMSGTDSCSQFPELLFNKKGKYTIKLLVENCSGKDSLTRTEVLEVLEAVKPINCTGVTTNNGNFTIGITKVEIDTFSRASGDTYQEGAYIDLACSHIIPLKSDTGYFTRITTGNSYNENVKIYIDFNNNGDLSDAGELVFSSPLQKPTHEDTIRIPKNPVMDKILRMRVMSDFDTIPDNPCDTLKYGQMEDYGVVIQSTLPIPLFGLADDSVCLGGNAAILDSSVGNITNYKWRYTHKFWTDSNSTAGDHDIQLPFSGFYKIELLLNDGKVAFSKDSAVFVIEKPIIGLSLEQGISPLCQGELFELKAIDTSSLVTTFNWFRDGVDIGSASSNRLINPSTLSDSGTYSVSGSHLKCADTSGSVHISILPTPISAFTPSTLSSCFEGNRVDFTNNSSVPFGTLNYSWDFGGNGISSIQNPSHSFTDTGVYSVNLIVSVGKCSDTTVQDLTILENPNSSFIANSDSQCLKSNEFIFTNSSTSSNGALTQKWDFGDASNSSATSPVKSYSNPGSFQVQLISSAPTGCSDTLMKTIKVHPQIKSQLNWTDLASSSCLKNNLQNFKSTSTIPTGSIVSNEIKLGDGNSFMSDEILNYSYSTPGSYTVSLIEVSDKGCSDTANLVLNIHPDPIAQFSVNDTNQCFEGNSFIWTNLSSLSAGSITRNEWDFGNASASSSASPTPTNYALNSAYNITLIVESDLNCSDTATLIIQVYPSPEPSFEAIEACVGESIQLNSTSTIASGSINSFSWEFGDGVKGSGSDPTHKYLASGSYNITLDLSSDQGCIGTTTLNDAALIHENPLADFSTEKVRSWGTETEVQFTNLSSSDVTIWNWIIENSGSFNSSDPLVTFQDTGLFDVLLVVENGLGCSDTARDQLFIFPEGNFLVPTSFSPNSDGINDIFTIRGVSYAENFSMIVFNRWGQKVFESNDISKGWDGKFQNEYVLNGTYLYKIEFQALSGSIYYAQGPLLMLR